MTLVVIVVVVFPGRIIAIGVNTTVDEEELNDLASQSDFVIKLADFPDIPAALEAVEDAVCENVPSKHRAQSFVHHQRLFRDRT